jgi:hypothetical protein
MDHLRQQRYITFADLHELSTHLYTSALRVQTIRPSIRQIPTEKIWKQLVLVPVPVHVTGFSFPILWLTFKKEKGNFIMHHFMLDLSC